MPASQAELLAAMRAGVVVHYIGGIDAHYFRNDNMRRVTGLIRHLMVRGFVRHQPESLLARPGGFDRKGCDMKVTVHPTQMYDLVHGDAVPRSRYRGRRAKRQAFYAGQRQTRWLGRLRSDVEIGRFHGGGRSHCVRILPGFAEAIDGSLLGMFVDHALGGGR